MNLIWVDIDCLRADKVGCYGARTDLTPRLDRLAAEGVVFTQAITAADTTGPSHASILTSSYPPVHRFTRNAIRFPLGGGPRLAQVLQQAGVATAAAVGVEHLSTFFRFGEGFDAYFNSHWFDLFFHYATLIRLPGFRLSSLIDRVRRRFPRLDTHSCSGDLVNRRILRWIRRNARRDFFVWVHYFDLHYPYEGEAGYERRVTFVDGLVGQLVDQVVSLGLGERTVWIVSSDHGEAFGEHGHYRHKNAGLYDETIRVPLLMSGGPLPRGQRVGAQVRTIDLAPTILDLFHLSVPPQYQGGSLLPWIRGERADHLPALSYGYPTDRGSKCLRTGEWKYICHRDGRDELYCLVEDPAERHNRISDEAVRVRDLKSLFFDLENHPAVEEEVEDEVIRHMLEGLGYLG